MGVHTALYHVAIGTRLLRPRCQAPILDIVVIPLYLSRKLPKKTKEGALSEEKVRALPAPPMLTASSRPTGVTMQAEPAPSNRRAPSRVKDLICLCRQSFWG